jgi:hypothetical protein
MGGEKDKSKKVTRTNEEIYGLVKELDEKVDDLGKSVVAIETQVCDMATRTWVDSKLADQRLDCQGKRMERMQRAQEQAQAQSVQKDDCVTHPDIKKAKVGALQAKTKLYIALAGAIGAAGAALVSWITSLV